MLKKHTSDLDEWIIQVEYLYGCTLYNLLRVKWHNSHWKPKESTHWGQDSKVKKMKSQAPGRLLMTLQMVTSSQTWLKASVSRVSDSTMYTMASPDSFTPVTCAQCEPALIGDENGVSVGDLLILMFPRKCQSSWTVLSRELRSHWRMSGPHATLMESVSDSRKHTHQ